MIEQITNLWPVLVTIGGLSWKQISLHFKVASNKERLDKIEENQKLLKIELHDTIKEQNKQTQESIRELTKATGELVVATKVMAAQLQELQKRK